MNIQKIINLIYKSKMILKYQNKEQIKEINKEQIDLIKKILKQLLFFVIRNIILMIKLPAPLYNVPQGRCFHNWGYI